MANLFNTDIVIALRILQALKDPVRPRMNAEELAVTVGVESTAYLHRIMSRLVRGKLLLSLRGRGGGYLRYPRDVRLPDVLEALGQTVNGPADISDALDGVFV